MIKINKGKKTILIIFLIALIPTFIIGKRLIALDLQRQAIELCSPFSVEKDFEAALSKIDLALKLAPRNYLFYGTKAEFLVSQKKLKESNTVIRQIFDFKEDYAEGYVMVAMNYERMDQNDSAKIIYQKALETYQKRIEKNKPDKDLLLLERLNIGFILRKLGQDNKAKQLFEQLKKEYPGEMEYIKAIENQELDIHNVS
ncbi:MAG: tetratricopeptide repeat protein [Marinilabiliaceae bacterium]|nr:tetratricopeptide repeat protein [Marinilabiliaceae bacterium]